MLIFPSRALTVEGVSNVLLVGQPEHSIAAEVLGDLPLCAETPAARCHDSRGGSRPRRERARHWSGHSHRLTSKLSRQKNSASPPPCR